MEPKRVLKPLNSITSSVDQMKKLREETTTSDQKQIPQAKRDGEMGGSDAASGDGASALPGRM